MKKKRYRLCALLLAGVLLLLPTTASAATAAAPNQRELSLSGIRTRQLSAYATVSVVHNGQALGAIGRRINGELYLPIRAFVEATSTARVTYRSATRTLTVTGGGHDISVTDGAYVLYAGGRALFATTPAVILSNGSMYIPAATLAKALSLTCRQSGGAITTSGTVRAIPTASQYYSQDELTWLARIISAESQGETLLGQIAVGNVILNRVASPLFPNTIWGVIFDRRYGIQFSPVENGTVYNTPTYTATLAAKICLEGFRLSDEILYFLAPSVATSGWISKNRVYCFTVLHHEFYA